MTKRMQRIKKNESGRSMVEMLGVLAVLGVLSIGGVQGYTYAMNKYHANQLMNDVNMRMLDLSTQASQNKELSLDEWADIPTLYPIELIIDENNDHHSVAYMQVSNVPENICKILINELSFQFEITVNNTLVQQNAQTNLCINDNNQFSIYIENNLQPCGTIYCSLTTPFCLEDKQMCVECLTNENCPSKNPICNTNNRCEACPNNKPYYGTAIKACGNCRSDNDCGATQLCLTESSDGSNTCKTYGYDVILSADESPDNNEYIRPYIKSKYISYYDAEKICAKLGRTLASPDDFLINWQKGGALTKTETGIKIGQKDGLHHTWVQGKNNQGQVLLINMTPSETTAVIYYYGHLDAGFYAYCK